MDSIWFLVVAAVGGMVAVGLILMQIDRMQKDIEELKRKQRDD